MSISTEPNVDDFVMSGGAPPAAKWPEIGSVVKGEVIAARVGYERDFETGEIARWPNGDPKKQLQVDLETPDGETIRIYAKPACKDAIREAVEESGGKLSDGGTLTVRREPDGEPTKKGFNAPHQFKAKFEPRKHITDDIDF